MGMIGKLVGGTIGFAMGGPLGAIAGAVFGHAFDKSNHINGYLETEDIVGGNQTAQLTFFVAAFSMLAKIANADGDVTNKEVDSVERFMATELNLDPESRRVARDIFQTAIHSPESFHAFASQFYGQFQSEPRLLEMMIDIMLRVSVADGRLSPAEEALIVKAVGIFHLGDAYYQQIKSKYVKTDVTYDVLGCRPSDTDEQIKKQYRKLVSEYHPDKIASKGLPEAFIQFANDKFREIQAAYDEIKKSRNIK